MEHFIENFIRNFVILAIALFAFVGFFAIIFLCVVAIDNPWFILVAILWAVFWFTSLCTLIEWIF